MGSILMMSWKMMNCRSKFKLVKRDKTVEKKET